MKAGECVEMNIAEMDKEQAHARWLELLTEMRELLSVIHPEEVLIMSLNTDEGVTMWRDDEGREFKRDRHGNVWLLIEGGGDAG